MMSSSVSSNSNLQSLLTKLNYRSGSSQSVIEQLLREIEEISRRYSNLAKSHLKVLNEKNNPETEQSLSNSKHIPSSNDTSLKFGTDIRNLFMEAGLVDSQLPASDGTSNDVIEVIKMFVAKLKTLKSQNQSLHESSNFQSKKISSLETKLKQYDLDSSKHAEIMDREVFFKEFEGLLKEDLKKAGATNSLLNDKIKELKDIIINSGQDTLSKSAAGVLENLQTELNFNDHLRSIIEKLNARRIKQDSEIDNLRDKIGHLENNCVQADKEKMEALNQKKLIEVERENLISRANSLSEELNACKRKIGHYEQELSSKKEINHKMVKMTESAKLTIENMKEKERMVKKHIAQQDSEISKLKNRFVDQEKKIKMLANELRTKEERLENVTSEKSIIETELKKSTLLITQLENSKSATSFEKQKNDGELTKLKENLSAKQKEKDNLMISYSKLIKSHEALTKDASKMKAENLKLRELMEKTGKDAGENPNANSELRKQILLLQNENQRLSDLNRKLLEQENGNKLEFGAKLAEIRDDQSRRIRELEREVLDLSSKAGRDRNTVEDDKRQIAALEAQCQALKSQNKVLNQELSYLRNQQNILSEYMKNGLLSGASVRTENRLQDIASPDLLSPLGRRSSNDDERALRLLQNLKNQKEQLKEELNDAKYNAHFPEEPVFAGESSKQILESENKLLMEIVSQVRSDLQKASSLSPSHSVFSP